MERKSSPTLFISYSYKDKDLTDHLAKDLVSRGIDVMYDATLLAPGEPIRETLVNSLKNADVVLVIVTENSVSSSNVMSELGMAQELARRSEGRKLLLSLLCGDVRPPYNIANDRAIYMRLPDSNSADYQQAVNEIFNAVNKFFQRILFLKESANESNTSSTSKKNPEKRKSKSKSNISQSGNPIQADEENILERNYWLLKLNPQTWEIDELKFDINTFFSTYYLGIKRPEYDLFKKIKKGDYVLGFASGDFQSIVCAMKVFAPVGPDKAQGEVFKMMVIKEIKPHIPLGNFENLIPFIVAKLRQNTKPPELFFQLSETEYKGILDSANTIYQNIYQPFYLTEGNHRFTDDQLDFENDINSFASVIALRKVVPPLAIGLFGNWGSGKSFFMEKLSERIEQIARSKEADYIENVVQVKFNSWHYSDANLWASLITQIFESLHDYATKKQFGAEAIKAIYKDLNITSQQLEETQKKLDANALQERILQEEKTSVEETIQQKKDRLDIWKTRDFITIVFSDPFIQQDFESIKEQFAEEKLIDNILQIDEKITQIDSSKGQVVESFVLLKKNHKGKWRWIWILAVVFGICIWLILGPLKEKVQEFINGGIIVTALILTWITNFVTKLSPYFKKVNQFYRRLQSLKQTIEKEKLKVKLKEHDEVNRLTNEINDLKKTITTLETQELLIKEKKAKIENAIKEIGSGKLLANFLSGKSTDDTYLKQLGIISWVRKDFAKLNELFQKQRSVQANEEILHAEVQIDRIVLYIDDLDRCNEEVVVKVLEAIHLLLAFPLFVVIVGVDPRWLNNALSEKYKTLFGHIEEKRIEKNADVLYQSFDGNPLLTGVATSYDYLEKIFQIPFALKPINKTGREKLIKYLIREEMFSGKNRDVIEENVENDFNNLPANSDIAQLHPEIEKENLGTPISESEEEMKNNTKKAKAKLLFTESELKYMQKLSSLFGDTPRTINRYVNIYRIIKAHGNLKVIGDFEKEEFMPIMFMLSIIVGNSVVAEKFIDEVSKADNGKKFKDFISESGLPPKLKTSIIPLTLDIDKISMESFKRNVELISRFSFRTLLIDSN